MAMELQQKLEEKQKKCQEIKLAFLELKREVAKKAAFSRNNDKPLSDKQIEDWETREMDKAKNVMKSEENMFYFFVCVRSNSIFSIREGKC